MSFHLAKRWIERVFHCRIYRHTLPRGSDIIFDLARLKDFRPTTIFDVGANIGQTAAVFSAAFPQAKVFSFEPVSGTFRELVEASRGLPNVVCEKLAFGSAKGAADLHVKPNSTINSLVAELNVQADSDVNVEQVTIETLDEWCRQHSIDAVGLLKIDTEGFDLEVLKGATRLLREKRVAAILVETGFDAANKQHVLLEDFQAFLDPFGFRLYGLYEQTTAWTGGPRLLFCNALFIEQGQGRQTAIEDEG